MSLAQRDDSFLDQKPPDLAAGSRLRARFWTVLVSANFAAAGHDSERMDKDWKLAKFRAFEARETTY